MNNNYNKQIEKTKELLEIINISEEEVEKLNHREKQKYYNAKTKLGTIVHRSRDNKGNGITFKKAGNK